MNEAKLETARELARQCSQHLGKLHLSSWKKASGKVQKLDQRRNSKPRGLVQGAGPKRSQSPAKRSSAAAKTFLRQVSPSGSVLTASCTKQHLPKFRAVQIFPSPPPTFCFVPDPNLNINLLINKEPLFSWRSKLK